VIIACRTFVKLNTRKMKKLITILFVAVLSINASAQDFEKNGNYVTVGYGLDLYGHPGGSSGLGLGPIMASYERGITDILGIGRIGVGGGVAFSRYSYKNSQLFFNFSDEYRYKTSRVTIFAKGAYHFEFDIEKMDVYAGVGAGLNLDSEQESYYVNGILQSQAKNSRTSVVHYVFVGIRYYFTDSFGVYAEAGDGIVNLNAGVVFKL